MRSAKEPSSPEGTTEAPSRELAAARGEIRHLGLTILYHPDLSRVGERALLSSLAAGRRAAISRLDPVFAAPGATHRAPLAHRRLSRRPLRLEPAGDGIRLQRDPGPMEILVDGEPLDAARTLPSDRLEAGTVLVLGGRVVLLLHPLDPYLDGELPSFGMVGESPPVVVLRRQIRQVADLPVAVLVVGETGTGKELAAAALHRASRRREAPLVTVNMAAIPPSLAAAELFGAARGAFTGADRRRQGFFSRADGGTLFLDEVGEMPAAVQTLLLRSIESGEIQPVGEAPRKVDVRLIAATDADLEEAVAAGRFRSPLLHRLRGFQLRLPPLRERREDFGRLLVTFLRQEMQAVGADRRLGADPPWLPADLVGAMARLAWPGNVRQLKNVVRQLVISQHHRARVVPDAAFEELLAGAAAPPSSPVLGGAEKALPAPRPRRAEGPRRPADISEEELTAALRAQRWRPHAAARQLGIPRPSIYHLIRKSARLRTAADLSLEDVEAELQRQGGDVTAAAAALEVSERALRRRIGKRG